MATTAARGLAQAYGVINAFYISPTDKYDIIAEFA